MTHAIFFNGPIGAGKPTLGRAVAARIDAAFLDGDDFSDHSRPWFASSLTTSERIASAALNGLAAKPTVVVAYPLRCTNFVYYRRRMSDAGHRPIFVTLRASAASILAADRGRAFDAGERERIIEMIAQGYGDRAFSDFTVDTDAASFERTTDLIVERLAPLLR